LESGAVQYFELDESSRASTPHAYIVPLAVIANYGIPPARSLAPAKRMESYKLFFSRLLDMNPWLTKVIE
jgi:hypothetical protein